MVDDQCLSRRLSQALAVLHSRLTVAAEMPITSALYGLDADAVPFPMRNLQSAIGNHNVAL